MALPATIFKAQLNISDMNRSYFADHALTLARHPSETDERMMVRLTAFALMADEALSFSRGLCVDDEPTLWRKSLSGEIELWVDVGQPDPKRLRKACTKATHVVLYLYGGNAARQWWHRHSGELRRLRNLAVFEFDEEGVARLTGLVQRSLRLQYTIQDSQLYVSDDTTTIELTVTPLHLPET